MPDSSKRPAKGEAGQAPKKKQRSKQQQQQPKKQRAKPKQQPQQPRKKKQSPGPKSGAKQGRLVFLGGVGEIGRNMAALELEGRTLLIDVGLSFPVEDQPGIDIVLPDFQYLRESDSPVEAVVLTHGHEDHIGAVPYLLREFGGHVPIYGTAFTLGLLRGKLEEHGVLDKATLHVVEPGDERTAGPFTFRYLRVTHSIPDGAAIAIDTPWGTVLHSGDFRLDQTPLDGHATDLQGFAQEAARGVHLFLSDSTNAEQPGTIASERVVGPVLREITHHADRLVVVACFSSHIHRIQQAADAAREDGRVVAFLGRSMHQSTRVARDLGLLDIPDRDIVPIEELSKLDPSRVMVICTGSQGEPMAALSLMASREHKWVKLKPDDT
ncbi:MAG: ribonuclease J, partial [Actinomycetota bacterium]